MDATQPQSISLPRALTLFDTVKGEYVWDAARLSEAILSLHFGAPRLRIREPVPTSPDMSPELIQLFQRRRVKPVGQSRLFVQDGVWTVTSRAGTCHRHDGEPTESAACLLQLSGQKLTDVSWDNAEKVWRFDFDLDGMVTIKSPASRDDTAESVWILFLDEEKLVLSCDYDGALLLEHSAASDALAAGV